MRTSLKKIMIPAMLVLVLVVPGSAVGDPMDELILDMDRKFEEMKPGPHSSVHSDYLIAQTAAGTFYITKALGILYEQNQALLQSNLEMISRYDKIIEQNQQIIELLKARGQSPQVPESFPRAKEDGQR